MMEFTNKSYAFVDGEARSLTDIFLDLEIRARRTITAALRQVERGNGGRTFCGQA
jgi:hypothetical protein